MDWLIIVVFCLLLGIPLLALSVPSIDRRLGKNTKFILSAVLLITYLLYITDYHKVIINAIRPSSANDYIASEQIEGYIFAPNNSLVSGVRVYIEEYPYQATVSKNGQFIIPHPTEAKGDELLHLHAVKEGYKEYYKPVQLGAHVIIELELAIDDN